MASLDTGGAAALLQVRQVRDIAAPRERVFAALTDPAHLVRWWGPDGFECGWAEIDLRPGGKFRIQMSRPETGYDGVLEGQYGAIDAPHQLVMEIHRHCDGAPEVFDATALGPTEVTITLEPLGEGGTRLTLVHKGFPEALAASVHEHGWQGSLSKLAQLFASSPAKPAAV